MSSLSEKLFEAAGEGDLEEMKWLLDHGANINVEYYSPGRTPLVTAIECGQEAAALFLIERGAWLFGALDFACQRGNETIARKLLQKGADANAMNCYGYVPLHSAVESGREDIARLLVDEYGARVDGSLSSPFSPLNRALQFEEIGIARFLLSAGANWRQKDGSGRNVLHEACEEGCFQFASEILAHETRSGRSLDEARDYSGWTYLHVAVRSGQLKTAELLVEAGVSIDAKDHTGSTPLHLAVRRKAVDIAEFLLDSGANIEALDRNGASPLNVAARVGANTDCILCLLNRGARTDLAAPHYFLDLDRALAGVLQKSFLEPLFNQAGSAIPIGTAALRWAMNSSVVSALATEKKWSLVGRAKTEKEEEAMRQKRLRLLRDDAWERRKHLVVDRALDWGYGNKEEGRGKAESGEPKAGSKGSE